MQKTVWLVLACALLGTSCAEQQKGIVISNTKEIEREELISIPYQEFTTHFGVDSSFSVKLSDSETELPYQLEKRGNSTPENVLIWVPIDAKIGRASCRERVKISVAGVTLKRKKA